MNLRLHWEGERVLGVMRYLILLLGILFIGAFFDLQKSKPAQASEGAAALILRDFLSKDISERIFTLSQVLSRMGPDSPLQNSATHAQLLQEEIRAAPAHQGALWAFYHMQGWRPIWGTPEFLPQTWALATVLANATAEGLRPEDYPIPLFFQPSFFKVNPIILFEFARLFAPKLLLKAEISFSRSLIAYARHAQAGRIVPQKVSPEIKQFPEVPAASDVLNALIHSQDPAATLLSYHPAHETYKRLRQELAALQNSVDDSEFFLPEGLSLRQGQKDKRVQILRKRLRLPIAEGSQMDVFDSEVRAAVVAFQKTQHLSPDGVVGPRTRAALNQGTQKTLVANLIGNMERWRWMPRNLGATHVAINLPEFKLRLIRAEHVVHEARVVVGKPKNQTPVFSDEMEYLVVNPYWNVPRSIAVNEMLPQIRAAPQRYFAQHGYQVLLNGRPISPHSVNWSEATLRKIRIRQVPGDRNALGRIKFVFPNQDAIYLHDTPLKSLFERPERALSHGCVRVDQPLKFAQALLQEENEWTGPELKKLFGTKERHIGLKTKIPVHFTYFTLFFNSEGDLIQLPDIYGHHKKLLKLLGVSPR